MTYAADLPAFAFSGPQRIAAGPLAEVARAVCAHLGRVPDAPVLVFARADSAPIDLDLRGSPDAVVARLEAPPPRERGRPRLGVTGREVTLLPRHWEWLGRQSGGTSVALRKLVEQAMRGGREQARAARDTAYRFMSAIAGDLPGFEEATRALFAGDRSRFEAEIGGWPEDIRAHAVETASIWFESARD